MGSKFNHIEEITPMKETWRIKVRIIHLWKVPVFCNPSEESIEMVLLDEKGTKIMAVVKKSLVNKYITVATIICIQAEYNWYYLSCKRCGKKVREVEEDMPKEGETMKKLYCMKCCVDVDAIPRYKVQVRVIDESGSASFVMFDRETSDTDSFPEELNELLNKKFLFKTKAFSDWILKVGDGNLRESNDGEAMNIWNPKYLQERAILSPTHEAVDCVNEQMLEMFPGEEKVYLSSDSICRTDTMTTMVQDIYTPDYLNSIRIYGLPNHKLRLKIGLCNGTRLQVSQLGNHVIKAKILSGNNVGHKVFIPRVLICPSDIRLPFKM